MAEVKKITLDDIFADKGPWELTWLTAIQIPSDNSLNRAQALLLMTQTARAIDWCGEKVALLVSMAESAKDQHKAEWSRAFLSRSTEKTAQGKKAEADCDPLYLEKKGIHTQLIGHLEYFKKKIEGLLTAHYAMKEIVKASYGESLTANWTTTDEAYNNQTPTRPQEQESPATEEEDDDFDL